MQSEATCKTSYIIIYIRQQKSIFTEERIFDVEELVEEFLGWKNSWKNFWGGRTCGRIFGVEELEEECLLCRNFWDGRNVRKSYQNPASPKEEFLGWKNLWKNFWGGRTCGRIFEVEELVEEFLGWKNLWKNFAVEEFVEEFCRGRILRWENFGNHHIGNNIFADKNSADWNVEPNC